MNKKKKTRGTEEKVQESVIKSDIAVLPAEVPTTNVNQEAANENKSEVPTSKRYMLYSLFRKLAYYFVFLGGHQYVILIKIKKKSFFNFYDCM